MLVDSQDEIGTQLIFVCSFHRAHTVAHTLLTRFWHYVVKQYFSSVFWHFQKITQVDICFTDAQLELMFTCFVIQIVYNQNYIVQKFKYSLFTLSCAE